jgi:hypothetical protein
VAEKITGGNVGCNSGATRVGVATGKLGKLPGGEAKLMRALAGSGVQQSSRSTVEQGGAARRSKAGGGTRVQWRP